MVVKIIPGFSGCAIALCHKYGVTAVFRYLEHALISVFLPLRFCAFA
ncbi:MULTISPECIES: hypothetical protein [unclassified Nodularia (in: cyanobacteria)]|nr:hypothetical protein [Nodularia sp. LEGE 04288]MCC2694674.1 hypothetical protein [Nodularia sp. LEGE 04288]